MPYTRWYEVADEDCEWVLLSGWLSLRCWHGVAVRRDYPGSPRVYVPLTGEVREILDRLASDARRLPQCLVRV
jgi:hypothetical protein